MAAGLIVFTALCALAVLGFRDWFEAWSALGLVSQKEQVVALVERWAGAKERGESESSGTSDTSSPPDTRSLAIAWTETELDWLFEGWLRDDDPRLEALFRELSEADSSRLAQRCERGCVCGNAEQRNRSLELLSLLPADTNRETLARLSAWAKRRELNDFFSRIEACRRARTASAPATISPASGPSSE